VRTAATMAVVAAPALAFDPARKQVFVVGNEAADVDSLVSAYAMARILDSDKVQGIALAQIPREEFRLRGDALALFGCAGSEALGDGSPAHLRFWDEVDWDAVRALDGRALVLTDHNKMTQRVAEHFEGRVEQILDHHTNSECYPSAQAEIVEGLGSACTLVTERLCAASMNTSEELGKLLAGVIILDTRNFDPKEAKGTRRDQDALDRLAAFLPEGGTGPWYEQLMAARKDISHLSVRELLLLDLKTVSASDGSVIAFSSIFGVLREVCERAGGPKGFIELVEAFAASKGYEAVVGLFAKDAEGRKAVSFVPRRDGERGRSICAALSAHLAAASPGSFPQAFRENPLFASQGLLEHGFELEPQEDLQPLMAFTLRGATSRKTVLPYAMTAANL